MEVGQPQSRDIDLDRAVSAAAGHTPLQIIVVGTGRSGTTSLFELIQRAFDAEGLGRTTSHEWNSVLLDGLYSRYLETGELKHLDGMKFIIMRCPHHCIQADPAWLPTISECLGTGLTIIHLERRDRERN